MASTMQHTSIQFVRELCHAEGNGVNLRSSCPFGDFVGGSKRMGRCVKMMANGSTRSVDTVNGNKMKGVDDVGLFKDDHEKYAVNKEGNIREYLLGRFVEDRLVYRQSFVIRSYEIGPDKTATMETLMNLLQETALNHVASAGVAGDGFGATREMSIRKLIWVVTRVHVQVEKYSSWGDLVEIDTWVDAAGKNGMRRDWIIRDYKTQNIITRATSTWVIMNRETRRLSKIPEEVKHEVQPFYLNRPTLPLDSQKIEKLTNLTAQTIRTGLAPRWSDMDANQHVNNVKYIGWLLESVPTKVLEDCNMKSMTLEYRRECRQSNVLESLTSTNARIGDDIDEDEDEDEETKLNSTNKNTQRRGKLLQDLVECTHLLRMEADQTEIVRARSVWQFKLH